MHDTAPASAPRSTRSNYVTEKTYIKRQLKLLRAETRKAHRLLHQRNELVRVQREYDEAMAQLHDGDVRPAWARQR